MATIKYSIQSKTDNAQIYLRLSLGRNNSAKRKTGLFINPINWSEKGLPKQNNPENKNLKTQLKELENEIIKQVNKASSKGTEITGDWLSHRIDVYFKRTNELNQSEKILDVIEDMKKTAKIRKNGKGGIGLSKSRINSYNTLKNMIESYQVYKKSTYKIKDVNIKFTNSFLMYLLDIEKYSKNYATKKIDDLKTVCLYAEAEGIETNSQLKKITTSKAKNEYIIYLNPNELLNIENVIIENEALNNARKWLLFGCAIGQRVGDLLSIDESNFVIRNGLEVIELIQQKGGKLITIPVLEDTKEILKQGLPYKISAQKFNKYIKKVCEIAGINQLTEGFIYDMVEINYKSKTKLVKRKIKGKFPKYQLVTSHICRRSFASNQYGKISVPLLRQITGHSTEQMFLKYIGKNSFDYAQQIADYYELLRLKSKKEPQLNIVGKKVG